MIRWTPHPPCTAGISPRIRPPAAPLPRGLAVLCLLVFLSSPAAGVGPDAILKDLDLMPGLAARISADGGLTFGALDDAVLVMDVAPPGDARRQRHGRHDAFGAASREGVPGGRRGFTDRADDDGDGRIDEDPLDGVDNDGDGRTDEDYAAIGDAMVAVHLADGPAGRPIHLEYYHWAHAHLRSAVFVAATGRPDLVDAGALRVTTRGEPWLEIALPGRPAEGPGHPPGVPGPAWVSRYQVGEIPADRDACDPRAHRWLGFRFLDPSGAGAVRPAGNRLDVDLSQAASPLVVAAASSRQQLLRILDQAVTTYRGVQDPVTGERTRWVAPPLCAPCRRAEPPAMSWRARSGGGVVLMTAVTEGHHCLPDPDLFAAGDGALGAPDRILWIPHEGKSRSSVRDCEGKSAWAPFVLGGAPGRIEYEFGPVDPDRLAGEIEGRYLDGRSFRARLTPVEEIPAVGIGLTAAPRTEDGAPSPEGQDPGRVLYDADHPPPLSSDLLEGWPNPFRDVIHIGFAVPRTLEEAFAWSDAEDIPAGLDLQATVPWRGGIPRVSVKIYSLGGQELVTLEDADLGTGSYTVQWNGTDTYGRQVASGTYFCKLQLDDWSVTRRLVFLR